MELELFMRLFDLFISVMLILEVIILIVNEVLKFIDGKYYKVNLKKHTDLLDDVIGAIDRPISVILLVWLVVSLGITFIK